MLEDRAWDVLFVYAVATLRHDLLHGCVRWVNDENQRGYTRRMHQKQQRQSLPASTASMRSSVPLPPPTKSGWVVFICASSMQIISSTICLNTKSSREQTDILHAEMDIPLNYLISRKMNIIYIISVYLLRRGQPLP